MPSQLTVRELRQKDSECCDNQQRNVRELRNAVEHDFIVARVRGKYVAVSRRGELAIQAGHSEAQSVFLTAEKS